MIDSEEGKGERAASRGRPGVANFAALAGRIKMLRARCRPGSSALHQLKSLSQDELFIH